MDLSAIWQFLPYAARINKAVQTLQRYENDPEVQAAMKAIPLIQRVEKDPDVQDAINLVKELTALAAKLQQPLQNG